MIITCASTKYSQFISHILNILLAPSHIIKKLDNGEIIEEVVEKLKEEKIKDTHIDQKNKKNKNKNKNNRNNRNNRNKNKNGEAKAKKEEPKLFEIKSLFTKNFKSLIDDNKNSKLLKMTPSKFYTRIVYMVKKRYGYELPSDLVEFS